MNCDDAELLKAALEDLMRYLEIPMRLAADSNDPRLKQMIGSLSADMIAKIDFEIFPYLYRRCPDLAANQDKS